MAILLHEVWWEPDGQGCRRVHLCLAGPDGDDVRKRLAPGSVCVHLFEADSPAQATTRSHGWLRQGPYPPIQPQDREPYPQEWANRQHGTMTDAELRAYGEVAQAVANHAYWMASPREYREMYPDVTGPIYYHWSSSDFEDTASNLWRLKIFKPLGGVINNWAFHFAFDCDLKDAGSVAMQNWRSGPLLIHMIENFVSLFGNYGDWEFSAEPDETFSADRRLEPALEALAAIGYLERLPDGFVWTQLAAPAMHSSYSWPLPDWPRPEVGNKA